MEAVLHVLDEWVEDTVLAVLRRGEKPCQVLVLAAAGGQPGNVTQVPTVNGPWRICPAVPKTFWSALERDGWPAGRGRQGQAGAPPAMVLELVTGLHSGDGGQQ
ncbi:hypothetical protein [Streptomyces sp. NPDC001903]|uniref:hypothetical protein n=1 Tax=Streptomyces sp. NPDC001903 TaxID=3364622 RepID=UPI0036B20E54